MERAPITAAVLSAIASHTGFAVGDADAPVAETDETPDYPYYVVHEIPGGSYWGALSDAAEAADLIYQVDAVGLTAAQARGALDRARDVFVGRTAGDWTVAITPGSGPCVVKNRVPEGTTSFTTREAGGAHDVYTSVERFVLQVVPS